MLTVACVYSEGGDFRPEHVFRLRDQVQEHLPGDFHFVCLSDTPVFDIPNIHFKLPLKGWWLKLALFHAFRHQTLYFDLDTDILGDISWLFSTKWPSEITGHQSTRDGGFASGMMYWNGDYSAITEEFLTYQSYYGKMKGDQDAIRFICQRLNFSLGTFQETFPNEIVSYKRHVMTGKISRHPSIILYHGNPRPWNISENVKNRALATALGEPE